MWPIFSGTIVNVITVAVGSVLGISISRGIPERYRLIVLQTLGLITLTLGMDAAVLQFAGAVERFAPAGDAGKTYGALLGMVMIGSLLVGVILGTALKLHERIESLGKWLHRRSSSGDGHRFSEGFLSASVLFCVGPLTLVGCLENGANGNPSFLYIKSLLDCFASLALASTLGWGVFASVLTVGIFQGGLSLLAYWVATPLDDLSIALMTNVGGVIMLGTGIMLLEIKPIRVANMVPAIFLPPLVVFVVERLSPGTLLPVGG
jgi:uncharacterized protein